MNAPARKYHHGDLRNALIIAAAELMENTGSSEFSITDAAKLAGVSNAAPYRHFKDREELLLAVRDLAFIGLDERMHSVEAEFAERNNTLEFIVAIGQAYLQYARDKSAFFALMWEDRGDAELRKEQVESLMSGFYVLVEAIKRYGHNVGHSDNEQAVAIATHLWATAHGIATLEANKLFDLFYRQASPDAALKQITRALFTSGAFSEAI